MGAVVIPTLQRRKLRHAQSTWLVKSRTESPQGSPVPEPPGAMSQGNDKWKPPHQVAPAAWLFPGVPMSLGEVWQRYCSWFCHSTHRERDNVSIKSNTQYWIISKVGQLEWSELTINYYTYYVKCKNVLILSSCRRKIIIAALFDTQKGKAF